MDTADAQPSIAMQDETRRQNSSSPTTSRTTIPDVRICSICSGLTASEVDGDIDQENRVQAVELPKEFPTAQELPGCSEEHSLDICKVCLQEYVRNTVSDSLGLAAYDNIKCPKDHCGHFYTFQEVKALTTPTTFARYDELLLVKHLIGNPDFRCCLHPNCSGGAIYDTWDQQCQQGPQYIECWDCKGKTCIRHSLPVPRLPEHHDDERPGRDVPQCFICIQEEGGQEQENDESVLPMDARPCPNPLCGTLIKKISGCYHMACILCGLEFCYACSLPWEESHFELCPFTEGGLPDELLQRRLPYRPEGAHPFSVLLQMSAAMRSRYSGNGGPRFNCLCGLPEPSGQEVLLCCGCGTTEHRQCHQCHGLPYRLPEIPLSLQNRCSSCSIIDLDSRYRRLIDRERNATLRYVEHRDRRRDARRRSWGGTWTEFQTGLEFQWNGFINEEANLRHDFWKKNDLLVRQKVFHKLGGN